ncbi:hypothetical protein ORQ98_17465 [Spartinivicinus sp. A2-2]|uniref:Uncharacterized protein n=1 Tax=Spartinivicinus poritis TaxID=2994640 RepID=A0ABT5UBI7_9GAMM|nr:hypothetical protein [Spartinivicinus sp. A2-2]MDE1463744.1 hypothetical protein [Spartinivicinus sp. A2-2]
MVEAKRENTNVAGKIHQAERYGRSIQLAKTMVPAWQLAGRPAAWADTEDRHYQVLFVYSCNGRPYI